LLPKQGWYPLIFDAIA